MKETGRGSEGNQRVRAIRGRCWACRDEGVIRIRGRGGEVPAGLTAQVAWRAAPVRHPFRSPPRRARPPFAGTRLPRCFRGSRIVRGEQGPLRGMKKL